MAMSLDVGRTPKLDRRRYNPLQASYLMYNFAAIDRTFICSEKYCAGQASEFDSNLSSIWGFL
jgi:hypothetical protein